MKEHLYLILGLWLLTTGCLRPLPPASEPPVVVEVRRLPPPMVYGTMVEEEDAGPVLKTWLSKEELDEQNLQKAIEKAAAEDPCQKGDPLCPDLPRK